jgi:carbon storage regulator
MLVLSRKLNQSIVIGDDIHIVVVSVDRDTVKLGIQAPREVPVLELLPKPSSSRPRLPP